MFRNQRQPRHNQPPRHARVPRPAKPPALSAKERRDVALQNANRLAAAPIGAAVLVRLDNGDTVQRTLETVPWLMGGHSWVVRVSGISGGYCCSRVTLPPVVAS